MAVVRTRRKGEVIREDRPVAKARKRTVRKPVVRAWGMTKTEERLATPMPVRKDLTMAQWRERGDALRILNRYSYINADLLSLNECRDAVLSIERCCDFRCRAM